MEITTAFHAWEFSTMFACLRSNAPHQPPKKVMARGMAIAADNVIVRMTVPVWMRVILSKRMAI
jgi:hypothetical protein